MNQFYTLIAYLVKLYPVIILERIIEYSKLLFVRNTVQTCTENCV